MKFREFKKVLKNEEYNIPNVLQKIKANMPKVSPRYINRKQRPYFRYAFGFASLAILLLFLFSSITLQNTFNEASGPRELNYFTSEVEITNTVKKFNKQKDLYLTQSQQLFENYTMSDIKINKVYDSNNNVAQIHNNNIYYLNSEGIVVYDTSNNELNLVFKENLRFDQDTNVKTLYIADNNLIVIYDNSNYLNVIKYDINSMNKLFTYAIASTYINSYVHGNNLFVVSILNDTVLPFIKTNEKWKKKEPSDIGYLENVVGESYTILTSINLTTNEQKETIFLSFNKWDIAYFNGNNLYLINNHMNYKKDLDYGEYATIVKFRNDENNGYKYHGSYTIKGNVKDKNNVFEFNNNLRVVLEVTHYKIKNILFFFKKVTKVEQLINVINLQSTFVDDKPSLELTSSYTISEANSVDSAISVLSTTFHQNRVIIESRGMDTNVTILDFHNPITIRTHSILKNKKVYSNLIALDENYGFSLRTLKTSTGEFELKFFDLTSDNAVEITEQQQHLNYSHLLNGSDYIVIEAIEHPNYLYLNQDDKYYYIGFNVQNNLNTKGIYTLCIIDKESKEVKFQEFNGNKIIEKVIAQSSNIIYGLANDSLVCFELNENDVYSEKYVSKIN